MLSNASPEVIEGFMRSDMESTVENDDFEALCFPVYVRYAKGNFWYVYLNLLCEKMIKENADTLERKCYVDTGSRTGIVLKHLQELNVKTSGGCDVYLQSLRFTSRRLPHIKLFQYNLFKNKLPYQYDVVGYYDLLEQVEEDTITVRNLTKILCPGAYLSLFRRTKGCRVLTTS